MVCLGEALAGVAALTPFEGRGVPRPRGMISCVSCSTVMVVSPLLRMSSASRSGGQHPQGIPTCEAAVAACERSARTHSVLLESIPPPAVDQLLSQMLLQPVAIARKPHRHRLEASGSRPRVHQRTTHECITAPHSPVVLSRLLELHLDAVLQLRRRRHRGAGGG